MMTNERAVVRRQKQVKRRTPNEAAQNHPDSPNLSAAPDIRRMTQSDILALQRQIGNQAVKRMLNGAAHHEGAMPTLTHDPAMHIQRLMGLGTFQTESGGTKKRTKIDPIDVALTAYEGKGAADFAGKKTELGNVIHACDTYLGLGIKARHKTIVRKLRVQAGYEHLSVSRLIDSDGASDDKQRYRDIADSQDAYVKGEALGNDPQYLLGGIIDRMDDVVKALGTADLNLLVGEDLTKLQNLAANPHVPEVTRRALNEVLANIGQVKLQAGKPGATLSKGGVAEKYTVNHAVIQPGGSAERLGSLAHELTHVSVSESFNNTPIFLAFAPGASDEEIVKLTKKRTDYINELEALRTKDKVFSPAQKSLLDQKLKYGKGNKLTEYANSYFIANKIDKPTKDQIDQWATLANNAVIEYDTVINQMLVYMHLWEIPQGNSFYKKLRTVAQDAFVHRENARG